jgi:thymidine phosphorylase
MSKKLAGGASCILLDVKAGSGAFMKDVRAAAELAHTCVRLGQAAGRRCAALVTDMDQPLGDLVGNAVEVREAVEVLRGERRGRMLDLCLILTGHLAALAGVASDPQEGRQRAAKALHELVAAQGGDRRVLDDLSLLPQAPVRRDLTAPRAGWLAAVDAEAVGRAAAALGAGRRRKEDQVDAAVAVELTVKLGDQVDAGERIGCILARDQEAAADAARELRAALRFSEQPSQPPPLVHQVISAP